LFSEWKKSRKDFFNIMLKELPVLPAPDRATNACFVLAAMALCLAVLPGFAPKINVVSIGDSWAGGWCEEMQWTILAHGVAVDVYNKGIAGSTATLWATPGALTDVELLLFQHPEIDWAVVSMGGNDLLDAYLLQGMGDAVFPVIEESVRAVLDQLVAFRPELKIAYNGYDFPNFEHNDYCIVMGQLMLGGLTYDKNVLFQRLTEIAQSIAADYPQVYAVDLLGTLQTAGGVPGAPNLWLPSPAQYFPEDDCIHPSDGGYWPIMDAIYEGFFSPLNGTDDDTDDDTVPADDTIPPDDDSADDTASDDTSIPSDDDAVDDDLGDDSLDDDWHNDDSMDADDTSLSDDAGSNDSNASGDDDNASSGCGC
jgi:lysophospholipase L1-like esterase